MLTAGIKVAEATLHLEQHVLVELSLMRSELPKELVVAGVPHFKRGNPLHGVLF